MKLLKLLHAVFQQEPWDEYLDRLTKSGIHSWGHGQSAIAFKHPTMPNVVVKVFTDKDLGYSYYLKWVTKNQNNPYAPKLHESPEYSKKRNLEFAPNLGEDHAYSIVFLEKLERSDPADRADFFQKITPWLIAAGYDRGERGFDSFPRIGIQGWRILTKAPDSDIAALAKCFVRGKSQRLYLDLGNSFNIMQRGRQLVFTDPFLPGGGI